MINRMVQATKRDGGATNEMEAIVTRRQRYKSQVFVTMATCYGEGSIALFIKNSLGTFQVFWASK